MLTRKIFTNLVYVDSRTAAKSIHIARKKASPSSPCFIVFDADFLEVLGPSPRLELIHERSDKFAHEAGVYIASTGKGYFTSNYQDGGEVKIYELDVNTNRITSLPEIANEIPGANGGCNYNDKVLFCAQGSLDAPSSLTLFDPKTSTVEVLLDNFYGREFNSINDVVIHHPTGDIWFTDPTYGRQQGFRPPPQLSCQVYRFRPSTGQVWCVADGFAQCNGLCFNPDYSKLYVTDTGATEARGIEGNHIDPTRPSTIYEYAVVDEGTGLKDRQVFAYCSVGVPDGIKCDINGYVYAGCGDGIHVWDRIGTLIGKIYTQGMVANFNFFQGNKVCCLAEEKLLVCTLQVQGALAKVEGHAIE